MSAEVQTGAPGEAGVVRMVATLTVAGLLSGLLLVGAYELTLPRIQANQARALEEAVLRVLPGTARMDALGWMEGQLAPVPEGAGDEVPRVYAGRDADGNLTGYAIPAEGPGFQDTIRLIYGYAPDTRTIVGMEVLESRETPGLGDKIFKDASFVANFQGLAVAPEVVAVPHGKKTAAHEVDCITGATISSKAVVGIVQRANETWLERLDAPEVAR